VLRWCVQDYLQGGRDTHLALALNNTHLLLTLRGLHCTILTSCQLLGGMLRLLCSDGTRAGAGEEGAESNVQRDGGGSDRPQGVSL
jgi:hypothetical protein